MYWSKYSWTLIVINVISFYFVVGGDGEGLDFGRRMSLSSSVGGRKYGRASDHGPGPRQVPVRHIPIVIEASDNDDSDFSDVTGGGQASGHTRLVTRGPVTVPINYSWSIVYTDRYLELGMDLTLRSI